MCDHQHGPATDQLMPSRSPDTRHNFVTQYQHQPGHLTGLLRVAVEPSLDVGVRQVAAISFKNLVKADWEPHGARPGPSTARQHRRRDAVREPRGAAIALGMHPAGRLHDTSSVERLLAWVPLRLPRQVKTTTLMLSRWLRRGPVAAVGPRQGAGEGEPAREHRQVSHRHPPERPSSPTAALLHSPAMICARHRPWLQLRGLFSV